MTVLFDVCVIGHVARDINTILGVEHAPSPGGAAYYSTMVYCRLGMRAAVVTKVAVEDEPFGRWLFKSKASDFRGLRRR